MQYNDCVISFFEFVYIWQPIVLSILAQTYLVVDYEFLLSFIQAIVNQSLYITCRDDTTAEQSLRKLFLEVAVFKNLNVHWNLHIFDGPGR